MNRHEANEIVAQRATTRLRGEYGRIVLDLLRPPIKNRDIFVASFPMWGISKKLDGIKHPVNWVEFIKDAFGFDAIKNRYPIKYKYINFDIDAIFIEMSTKNSDTRSMHVLAKEPEWKLVTPSEKIGEMDNYHTLRLNYLLYGVSLEVDINHEIMEDDVSKVCDRAMYYIGKFKADIYEFEPVFIRYYSDWWQAFKDRWFPEALLKRYPVQHTEYNFSENDAKDLFSDLVNYSQVKHNKLGKLVFRIQKQETEGHE